jgi:hypothetical protein
MKTFPSRQKLKRGIGPDEPLPLRISNMPSHLFFEYDSFGNEIVHTRTSRRLAPFPTSLPYPTHLFMMYESDGSSILIHRSLYPTV